jgi:hypothetical protein
MHLSMKKEDSTSLLRDGVNEPQHSLLPLWGPEKRALLLSPDPLRAERKGFYSRAKGRQGQFYGKCPWAFSSEKRLAVSG